MHAPVWQVNDKITHLSIFSPFMLHSPLLFMFIGRNEKVFHKSEYRVAHIKPREFGSASIAMSR